MSVVLASSLRKWVKIFFFKFYVLSNLYTPYGAQTHDPEIKSCLHFRPNQSGILEVVYVLTSQPGGFFGFVGSG